MVDEEVPETPDEEPDTTDVPADGDEPVIGEDIDHVRNDEVEDKEPEEEGK